MQVVAARGAAPEVESGLADLLILKSTGSGFVGYPRDAYTTLPETQDRILATALSRLRGKLKYRPVVFELMPEAFTLSALQRTVEAISGVALHKQNFRRVVERTGLVEGLGRMDVETGGRPAELFRFRRELLAARPASGLSLPLLRE